MIVKKGDFSKFILLMVLAFFGLLANNSMIALVTCILQVGIIISKARFSYISVFVFILNYSLIPQFIIYNGGTIGGILGLGYIKIYYFELFYCCQALNLVSGVYVFLTDFLKNEKEIYSVNYNFAPTTVRVMSVIAVVLTLLIFPDFSFGFDVQNRYSAGIIPFVGWSSIPFFLLCLGLLSKQCKKLVYASTAFVSFWYVFHAERVDFLGFFVFFSLIFFNSNKQIKLKKIGILIVSIALFVILIFVGALRDGNVVSLSLVIRSLVAQQTVCDVVNVFNAAVDLWYKGHLFEGITYLSYLVNCIPMLKDDYSFARLITTVGYRSVGGGLFFAEPIANFGFVFCFLEIILYFLTIHKLIKKKNKYRALVFSALCLSIFRTAWYGLNYSITTILYIVPFVLAVNHLVIRRNTRSSKL